MSSTLFIINDAPYGNERAYDALRPRARSPERRASRCASSSWPMRSAAPRPGKRCLRRYYNVNLMPNKVLRKGEVGLCGTCMDARGMAEAEFIEGAKRGTTAESRNGRCRPTRSWSSSLATERGNRVGSAT